MKILFLVLPLLFCAPAGFLRAEPEPSPQNAQAAELSSVKDRLLTSLFFRGELADKILDAGMAGSFVDLDALETNAEAKGALLEWIRKNPGKAAEVYLNMKGAGGRLHDRIETREMEWKFNPDFLDMIKALNAAAGSASVSREVLELAARRLYEGGQAETGGPEVRPGSPGAGGGGFFQSDYASYRLNKAGLERELSQAGAWLEAARGGAAPLEIAGAYSAAFSAYREFIVAASPLKSRGTITEKESARLEELRLELRLSLAALALRSRISALAGAEASLGRSGAEPGAGALLLAVSRLKEKLEASAGRIEAGGAGLKDLGRAVGSAENDFARLYLGYSAYDGLLNLKERSAKPDFSCLYDYAFYRYLSAFFPGSAYPRARAELDAAAGALDAALLKAGTGDLSGALSGLDTWRLEAAAAAVRSASSFNRGAQFFLWGLFFRPVEYKVSAANGRASFRPVFTLGEVAGRK